jgi:DNA replication protein DnaC
MKKTTDYLSNIQEALGEYRRQLASAGLTDRARIPDPKKCKRCDVLMPPKWSESPFGHWSLGGECAVCENSVDDEERGQRIEKAIARAKVPMRLRALTISALDHDRAATTLASACSSWDGRRWIIASGGVGTGKTSWLTALLLDQIRSKPKVKALWTSEQRLYRRAQLQGEKAHAGREKVVQEAIDADVLLLDDIGAGRRDLTEWQGGAMRDLLTERHLEGRPTLITTNLSVEAIAKHYGEHVASRLIEASGQVINLGGSDRRRRGSNSFLAFWGRR